MIIGVDFDDVTMDTFPEFLAYCNQQYDEEFLVEHFTSFEYNKVWNISKEEHRRRFLAFDDSRAKENIRPMTGAQEVIQKLVEVHELHIITARPEETAKGTWEMIDRYFPQKFKNVHFCSTDNGARYHRPKPLVCEEIEAVLHIEDHPVTAVHCAEHGIPTLLFDRIWNRSVPDHKLITRVHSWNEIMEVLYRL